MRLRTRVLSFMLAGSMMLSATPVSAFAETPVLGGGTVSPTALSETNSTDGVYSSRVDGSHELRCMGGIFTGTQNTTYNDAIYVVNQNSAPGSKAEVHSRPMATALWPGVSTWVPPGATTMPSILKSRCF